MLSLSLNISIEKGLQSSYERRIINKLEGLLENDNCLQGMVAQIMSSSLKRGSERVFMMFSTIRITISGYKPCMMK